MLIYFGTEGYRSGHNEAVLKTVWVHAHVGSNPTPSVKKDRHAQRVCLFLRKENDEEPRKSKICCSGRKGEKAGKACDVRYGF